jgi:hypothetical protein
MSTQFSYRYVGVDRFARLHLADALTKRLVERGTFFLAHVGVRRDKLDALAFGQVGGLVQDEPSVPHAGSEGLHRPQRLLRRWLVVEGGNGAGALALLHLLGFERSQ